jgi:hypothetical protein
MEPSVWTGSFPLVWSLPSGLESFLWTGAFLLDWSHPSEMETSLWTGAFPMVFMEWSHLSGPGPFFLTKVTLWNGAFPLDWSLPPDCVLPSGLEILWT